jgi:hypothetical protein
MSVVLNPSAASALFNDCNCVWMLSAPGDEVLSVLAPVAFAVEGAATAGCGKAVAGTAVVASEPIAPLLFEFATGGIWVSIEPGLICVAAVGAGDVTAAPTAPVDADCASKESPPAENSED